MYFLRVLIATIAGLLRNLFGGLFRALAAAARPVRDLVYTTFRIQPGEFRRPLIVFVAILVIGSSLVFIFLSMRSSTPRVNLEPFEAVGQILAEETARALGEQGRVVLVGYGPTIRSASGRSTKAPPMARLPEQTCRRTLAQYPRITLAPFESIEINPDLMIGPMSPLSANQFLGLLEKHRAADALVLFVAPPALTADQLDAVATPTAKVFVAQALGPGVRPLIDRGIVYLAVAPRFDATPQTNPPATPREWFDRYFQVVTATNADQLADFGIPPPPVR